MSCNNPLDKCCEITPSTCVLFTGTLHANSWLSNDCETSVTTLLEQVDEQIVLLSNGVRINISELTDADTCSKIDTSNIVIRPSDATKSDYVNASEVIKQLVSIVCDLQEQINVIYSDTQLSDSFFALELPDNLKNKFVCLDCDDECGGTRPTTFGSLFEIMIGKLLDYESKNTKLSCKDCGCVDC